MIVILVLSLALYVLSGITTPKRKKRRSSDSTYACGEKIRLGSLKVTIALHEYLTYFIILDSSVLLIAFASLSLNSINLSIILIYLVIVLVSSLILRGGD
ncbi:TPA: hypothetical protein EYP70_06005 [Candidatus Bathyarchaeota archaeon]|nr:hypothetical protein [Candidatus Bathyarchaeota archaeon]